MKRRITGYTLLVLASLLSLILLVGVLNFIRSFMGIKVNDTAYKVGYMIGGLLLFGVLGYVDRVLWRNGLNRIRRSKTSYQHPADHLIED